MNNDLISRSELLKHTQGGDWDGVGFSREYVEVDDIINAPPVGLGGHILCEWIPISDRLPEINVDVIVTDIETTGTYSAYYLGDGFWACDNGSYNNRIIAWQPFPKPYKEAGAE